jgi:hypothetical protein
LPRDAKEHQLGVVVLFELIVNTEPEVGIVRVWDARFSNQFADGKKGIEAFGNAPREAFAFSFILDVAGCYVDC